MPLGSPHLKDAQPQPPSLGSAELWGTLTFLLRQTAEVRCPAGTLLAALPSLRHIFLQAPAGLEPLWVQRLSKSQRQRVTRPQLGGGGDDPCSLGSPSSGVRCSVYLSCLSCPCISIPVTEKRAYFLCTVGSHVSGSCVFLLPGHLQMLFFRNQLIFSHSERTKHPFPLLHSHSLKIYVSSLYLMILKHTFKYLTLPCCAIHSLKTEMGGGEVLFVFLFCRTTRFVGSYFYP